MTQSLEDQIQRLIQDSLIQKQALERHQAQLQEQDKKLEELRARIQELEYSKLNIYP